VLINHEDEARLKNVASLTKMLSPIQLFLDA